jgi:dsDNA-binding SOS-regulon protein
MSRFIAVHTVPPMTEADWMGKMKEMSEKLSQLPPGVAYNLSYCDLADGKIFCDWVAPNKDTVDQVLKATGLPLDAVYPVKIFSPTKMGFED